MYRELHDSLSRAAEAARLRDCLRAQRQTLASSLAVERSRLAALGSQLDGERKDVARLEGISLQRLAAALEGNREGRLEKERREAVLAELRYAEHSELVARMITELDTLDRRIAELGDVDALHLAAMEEKARMLMGHGDEHGRLVAALIDQFSQACAMDRELCEVLDSGVALGKQITVVMSNLADALGRDLFDLSFGRRNTWAAHEAIAEASRNMQRSRLLFERYQKELADVSRVPSPHAPYDVLAIRKLPGPRLTDHLWGSFIDEAVRGRLEHVGRALGVVRYEVRQSLIEATQALESTRRARQELWTRLYEVIRAG